MARRDGHRAERVEHVRADPQVGVALAGARGERELHRLDRGREVAPGGVQEPEPADRVRLPAGVVDLRSEGERVLERLGGAIEVAAREPRPRRASASG